LSLVIADGGSGFHPITVVDATGDQIARFSYKGDATAFIATQDLLALAKALDDHSAWAIGFDLEKLPGLMDKFRAMASAAIAKAEGR
jgi:hypothetical protein